MRKVHPFYDFHIAIMVCFTSPTRCVNNYSRASTATAITAIPTPESTWLEAAPADGVAEAAEAADAVEATDAVDAAELADDAPEVEAAEAVDVVAAVEPVEPVAAAPL